MAEVSKPELQIVKIEDKPESPKLSLVRAQAFIPSNVTEAMNLARFLAKTDMVPKAFKGKAAEVFVAMQMGAELGLAPMAALQNIAVINGRPSLWGDAALAVVQRHPDYEWHTEAVEGDGDARHGRFTVQRRGQEPHTVKFSVADAKKAGLWNKEGPWRNYPDRMLRWRAAGFALRDKFADALRGMILAEEAADIPRVKTIEHGKVNVDVNAELATLSQSSEPNRGHGNEGFTQESTPTAIPAPTSAPEPKPEETPEQAPGDEPEPLEPQENGFSRGIVTVTAAELKQKRQGKTEVPYVQLTLAGKSSPIQVWHKTLHEFALGMPGHEVDLEVKPNQAQGRVFWSLEVIHRVDDVRFVNNQIVYPESRGTVTAEEKPLASPVGLFDEPGKHRDEG